MNKPGALNNAVGGVRPPVMPRLPTRSNINIMPSQYRSYAGYGYNNHYGSHYSNYSNPVPGEDDPSVFKSFEAAVRAFTSLADMIESTFQAMMLSYRAVVSVATNMTKLNEFIFSFISSISSLRTVSWFYYWIRRALGLVSKNSDQENVWSQSQLNSSQSSGKPSDLKSLFAMLIMLGTPYAVYKLLNKDLKKKPTPAGTAEAEALYDFEGDGDAELSFKKGDTLLVAQSTHPGWLVGKKDGKTGFVPQNRLKLYNPISKQKRLSRPHPDVSNPKASASNVSKVSGNKNESHPRAGQVEQVHQKVRNMQRVMKVDKNEVE